MLGGLFGGKLGGKLGGGSGSGGHGGSMPMFGQAPSQVVYAQKPPKKHGGGMGGGAGLAMGAGAGLLGGLLVADALDGGFDGKCS